MRSLEPASLSAEHVQRRPTFADDSPKAGNLTRYFAAPRPAAPPPPPRPFISDAPGAQRERAWPAFPVHHEERRLIEARGECVPVTHADLMRQARRLLQAGPPPRPATSLPRRIAGMFRVVGLGRRTQS